MSYQRNCVTLEPTLASMEEARERVRLTEMKNSASRIFVPSFSQKHDCSCRQCADVGGDRPQFCCRDLLSHSAYLSMNGEKMRKFFLSLNDDEWEGCITENFSFKRLFGDQEVFHEKVLYLLSIIAEKSPGSYGLHSREAVREREEGSSRLCRLVRHGVL